MLAWLPFSYDAKVASVRYRTLWPLAGLRWLGHPITLYQASGRKAYQTLLFSKRANAEDLLLARRHKERGGSVIFDICDNHLYNPRQHQDYQALRERLLSMLRLADRVICSTEALADVIRAELGPQADIVVVGDFAEPVESAQPRQDKLPFLLWFGNHGSNNADSGMTDLLRIAAPLAAQHARTPLQLVVISNSREKYQSFIAPLPFPTHYEAWDTASFPSWLAGAAAVLLPLSDNAFVRCKTHNRISLALRAGVPVVADTIPSYAEFAPFAYLNDWEGGLRAVIETPTAARARAAEARGYIDRAWGPKAVLENWEAALRPFFH